jgi:hypothetical protein
MSRATPGTSGDGVDGGAELTDARGVGPGDAGGAVGDPIEMGEPDGTPPVVGGNEPAVGADELMIATYPIASATVVANAAANCRTSERFQDRGSGRKRSGSYHRRGARVTGERGEQQLVASPTGR